MKSQADIVQKLKQVQFRHAKREIESRLAVASSNCVHNRLSGTVGACGSEGCPRYNQPCDDRVERVALSCGFFEPMHTPDEARVQVKRFFKESPPSEIAAKYADVAALLWVLDGDRPEMHDPCHAGTMGGFPIWADTPEAAMKVRAKIEDIVRENATLQDAARENATVQVAHALQQSTAKPISHQETLDDLKLLLVGVSTSVDTTMPIIRDELRRLAAAVEAPKPRPGLIAFLMRPLLLAAGLALGALFGGFWKKP